jgi:hypothetical protein
MSLKRLGANTNWLTVNVPADTNKHVNNIRAIAR